MAAIVLRREMFFCVMAACFLAGRLISNIGNGGLHSPGTVEPREGIYPLLRDFQCGHRNMETPRALGKGVVGNGRFVVDVGLDQGLETLDAVESGFVVFGFEMMTGSINAIAANAKSRNLANRIHIVEFQQNKFGSFQVKKLPLPPSDKTGFAYIFNMGLSDEVGAMSPDGEKSPVATLANHKINRKWSPGMVPIMKLEDVLPSWVNKIFMLKVDTQGFDLKVLKGTESYLTSDRIQYAQYEFSPKLMRGANSGRPIDLLQFMVQMGAVCFDMMGQHHELLVRPSTSLEVYLESLESGKHSTYNGGDYSTIAVGPWEDILCWFPKATN